MLILSKDIYSNFLAMFILELSAFISGLSALSPVDERKSAFLGQSPPRKYLQYTKVSEVEGSAVVTNVALSQTPELINKTQIALIRNTLDTKVRKSVGNLLTTDQYPLSQNSRCSDHLQSCCQASESNLSDIGGKQQVCTMTAEVKLERDRSEKSDEDSFYIAGLVKKVKKNRAIWTSGGDMQLKKMIETHGAKGWSMIAEGVSDRTGRQCCERWTCVLNPKFKKGPWTDEENQEVIRWHKVLGNQWAEIAKHIPGRTSHAIGQRYC